MIETHKDIDAAEDDNQYVGMPALDNRIIFDIVRRGVIKANSVIRGVPKKPEGKDIGSR
jgi:hypothetical protein